MSDGGMPAIFLDRDGVINELIYHQDAGVIDSPFTLDQFRLLPGVGEAIQALNRMGKKIVVVSNQPGVARDHFTEEFLSMLDAKMKAELAKSGAFVDAVYYCPHHPEGSNRSYSIACDCRKPRPGLLLKAAKELNIKLASSYMIGDSVTDIQAGQSAGCRTILLARMKCELCHFMADAKVSPDFIVSNLGEAVKAIKQAKESHNGNIP